MSDQEEMARLWETAPIFTVQAINDHGVERLIVDDDALQAHLSRLALYFFRGGVAYARNTTPRQRG